MFIARRIKRLLTSVVAILVGIAFVVVGSIIANINKGIDYVEVTGTIDRIVTIEATVADEADDHEVYVNYTYEGQEYTGKYGSYSVTMKVGDEVTVLVDSSNPANITSKGGTYMPYIFIGAGVLVILGGAFGVFKSIVGAA